MLNVRTLGALKVRRAGIACAVEGSDVRRGGSFRRVGGSSELCCYLHRKTSFLVCSSDYGAVASAPDTIASRSTILIVTPWLTMPSVRVRLQVDAVTRCSSPATPAGTASTFLTATVEYQTLNLARLKCDRQQPCGACLRRGAINSCNYATTSASFISEAYRSVAPPPSTSLRERISDLESLVVTLMKDKSLPTPPALQSPSQGAPPRPNVLTNLHRPKRFHDEPTSPADPGTLKVHESRTSYVQSVHWEAILSKIRGLREDLGADNKAPPGSHLFYGPNRHATREEILAAVPLRPVVDRLLALHFDAHIITPCQSSKALLSAGSGVNCRRQISFTARSSSERLVHL